MTHKTLAQTPRFPNPWPIAPLDPGRAPDEALLENIQGNILQGHGRDQACLVFWRCATGARWSAEFWTEVAELVTTAREQETMAREKETEPNSVFRSFALSAAGMRTMGVADPDGGSEAIRFNRLNSDRFSEFNKGMDRPNPAPADMPAWLRAPVHGVWIVACQCPKILHAEVADLVAWGRARGLISDEADIETLTTWRNDAREPREPFGFVDGISVPTFFMRDIADGTTGGKWSSMPLEEVLIDPAYSMHPEHEGGTFLAVQKLDQNVAAFRGFEEDMKKMPGLASLPQEIRDEPGALLVGRMRDGSPLAPLLPPGPTKILNAFDFERDTAAQGCPFHAHIRKMNSRTEQPLHLKAPPGDDVRKTQLVRRGMIYDPAGSLAKGEYPKSGVGLLFLGYTSNLLGTFTELTKNWSVNANIPATSGPDPILAGAGQPWGWPDHVPPVGSAVLPQIVTNLGGEFFYVPSMRWFCARTGPQ